MTAASSPTPDSAIERNPTRGRWWIVVAAVLVQLALGAVYAWSVFNKPLQGQFGWSKGEAVLPFEVVIGTIFIGSLIGGRIQDRRGPRPVALSGVILYSVGVMLASLVSSSGELWLLVLTYGAMGGIGLGAAYITPIAMLAKWFPDRRGLITGIAVAGFGFGAVITAPVAKALLGGTDDKTSVFLPLGIAYLIAGVIGAFFFRNPPEGYRVPGWVPKVGPAVAGTRVYTLAEALRTPQWYMLTAILALNVTCGIAFISQAADAAEEVAGSAPSPPRVWSGSGAVQRRRPGVLGVAVGPHRPDAGVPRHAGAAGDLLLRAAARRGVRPVRHPGRARLSGVRRRLRHHAGDRGGLFRYAERGRDLRRDDRGVEHRRRGRAAAAGRTVRVQRQLHAGVHGHRHHRAGVDGAAADHEDAVRTGDEGDGGHRTSSVIPSARAGSSSPTIG
jgi:MFS family permease